jgi:hypothetical protein
MGFSPGAFCASLGRSAVPNTVVFDVGGQHAFFRTDELLRRVRGWITSRVARAVFLRLPCAGALSSAAARRWTSTLLQASLICIRDGCPCVITVPASTASYLGASMPDYATFPSGFVYNFGAVIVATFRVGTAELLRFCERAGVPQIGGASPRIVVDLLTDLAQAATNNLEYATLCRLEGDIGQGPVWGMGASFGAPAATARHRDLSYSSSQNQKVMTSGDDDNDSGGIIPHLQKYITKHNGTSPAGLNLNCAPLKPFQESADVTLLERLWRRSRRAAPPPD